MTTIHAPQGMRLHVLTVVVALTAALGLQVLASAPSQANAVAPIGMPVTTDLTNWYNSSTGDAATGVGAPSPGYSVSRGLGGVYSTPTVPGTHALYECVIGTDRFTSTDPGCEGQTLVGRLGWIYDSQQSFPATAPLYRCRASSPSDHYDSTLGCFGTDTYESTLGYVVAAFSLARYYLSSTGDHTTGATEPPVNYGWEKGLGEIWLAPVSGTHPLYSCTAGTDGFTSTDSACNGASAGGPSSLIGYVYDQNARPWWLPTAPLYACAVTGTGERFDSNDPSCEGQSIVSFLGWVVGYQTLARFVSSTTGDHATRVSNPGGSYGWEQPLGEAYLPDASPIPSDTHAIYECQTALNNAPDQFTSTDPSCEGHTSLGILGYVFDAAQSGMPTVPLYRCHTSIWEHFDSNDPGCEGQTEQELLGYTLAGFPVDYSAPTVTVTQQPSYYTNQSSASFAFTVSDPDGSAQGMCAVDAPNLSNCNGRLDVPLLPDGYHTFYLQAVDLWGNASPMKKVVWLVDTAPPIVGMTAPTATFTLARSVTFAWFGEDNVGGSGLEEYLVRYSRTSFNSSGFGIWRYPPTWQGLPGWSSSSSLAVTPGGLYCFSAQAWDHADNGSQWAVPSCVAVPLDDRSLTASAGWTRATGSAYWNGTVTRTTRFGATLRSSTANVDRVGIVATRCSACGAVAVYVGSIRIGVINLHATTTRYQQLIALPRFSYRSGVVTIRVITSGKIIQIDGLALSRM